MSDFDNRPSDPEPDDEWTLNERLVVLWDRAAVRWLVALLVGALVVAVFAMVRSAPSESASVTAVTAQGSAPPVESGQASTEPGSSNGVASSTPELAGEVIVDVIGRVRTPGVVTLPAGSRVADAVAAAGGLSKGKTTVNLARVLIDGEQIDVSARAGQSGGLGATTAAGPSAGLGATGAAAGLINLNMATATELQELPRVGPVTAEKIIDFRTQYGGFRSVAQLKEVSGVGDVTFAGIEPLVTV